MSADVKALYQAYLDFEALPAKNAAAAAQAAERRARHVESGQQAIRKERQRHAAAVSLRNEQHQSAVATAEEKTTRAIEALDQRLDALTRSASGKGAVAAGGFAASGRPLSFSAAEALDTRLGELSENKRGIEHSLAQLRLQLEREAGYAKAAGRDRVTWSILGMGLMLAIVTGANAIAAAALIAAATAMQFRLGRGPSAFMNKRFEKRPILAADARARSGLTRKLASCYILLGLTATAMVSAAFVDEFPFWSRLHLWREEPFTAFYMLLLFWPPYLYGIFLLINGSVRSAGSRIRLPGPQSAGGYTPAPPVAAGGRGTPVPAPQPGETDDRGHPLQWRPVLKHEWVDEALRDPERLFSAGLRKRVHERAGRQCEAVYYDPFRTEWKRCTSRSQEADHIYPHATGGRSTPANAQALCQKCNVQKGVSVPTAAYVAALQDSRQGYFPSGESPTVRKA
jgi:hypothetical protein